MQQVITETIPSQTLQFSFSYSAHAEPPWPESDPPPGGGTGGGGGDQPCDPPETQPPPSDPPPGGSTGGGE